MSAKNIELIASAQKTGLDAFLAISEVYLLSNERLSMLNAAAIRDSVVEAASLASMLADAKTPQDVQGLYAALTKSLFTKAVNYTQSVLEIASQTQASVGGLNQVKLDGLMGTAQVGEMWQDAFGAVTKGLPQWLSSPVPLQGVKLGNGKAHP